MRLIHFKNHYGWGQITIYLQIPVSATEVKYIGSSRYTPLGAEVRKTNPILSIFSKLRYFGG